MHVHTHTHVCVCHAHAHPHPHFFLGAEQLRPHCTWCRARVSPDHFSLFLEQRPFSSRLQAGTSLGRLALDGHVVSMSKLTMSLIASSRVGSRLGSHLAFGSQVSCLLYSEVGSQPVSHDLEICEGDSHPFGFSVGLPQMTSPCQGPCPCLQSQ